MRKKSTVTMTNREREALAAITKARLTDIAWYPLYLAFGRVREIEPRKLAAERRVLESVLAKLA